jgi:hypothetical protein
METDFSLTHLLQMEDKIKEIESSLWKSIDLPI